MSLAIACGESPNGLVVLRYAWSNILFSVHMLPNHATSGLCMALVVLEALKTPNGLAGCTSLSG